MKNVIGVISFTFLFLFSLSSFVISDVNASQINYSFTGTGSGTIGASTFTNEDFEVSINADTNDIGFQNNLGTIGALNLSGTIDITGIGDAGFTSPLFVFGPSGSFDAVGFGNFTQGNSILISSLSLIGYDLISNFGPLTGPNSQLSQFHNVGTNFGNLTFSTMSDVTFVATTTSTPVPEPTTILLLGTGLAGLAVIRRKKTT